MRRQDRVARAAMTLDTVRYLAPMLGIVKMLSQFHATMWSLTLKADLNGASELGEILDGCALADEIRRESGSLKWIGDLPLGSMTKHSSPCNRFGRLSRGPVIRQLGVKSRVLCS